ncbi:hypothetical protein [Methylobacterium sp. 37f]|uniref:hypothetical protein n=1 Tax=Methylobacterium sp. 37f TaxID=2817058 RepID=UPI001FFD0AC3|nr:hypothetical protein [Methylobacterium sp. 37f]MCK2054790.1 hypothetical protein [Methylobacterium sp. 37f]
MPMTFTEVKRLVKILGPKGAVAGLLESDVNTSVLKTIATKEKLARVPTNSRMELINMLVDHVTQSSLKPTETLMRMSYDELLSYFNEAGPSTESLMKIMKELNYKVGSEDKKHLRRFVARQISETALFSNVATRDTD